MLYYKLLFHNIIYINYIIHPFALPLILRRVAAGMKPIRGNSGHMAGDTLDSVPTYDRAQSHTQPIIHYGQIKNAKQSTTFFVLRGNRTTWRKSTNPDGT